MCLNSLDLSRTDPDSYPGRYAGQAREHVFRGIGVGAHLPVIGHWAHRWINHGVCDAWPVQRQAYGYLPSLRRYQIYTAWWQLTAQDINPVAYVLEFAWHNFASLPGFLPRSVPGYELGYWSEVGTADQASKHVLSLAVALATTMLNMQLVVQWKMFLQSPMPVVYLQCLFHEKD